MYAPGIIVSICTRNGAEIGHRDGDFLNPLAPYPPIELPIREFGSGKSPEAIRTSLLKCAQVLVNAETVHVDSIRMQLPMGAIRREEKNHGIEKRKQEAQEG